MQLKYFLNRAFTTGRIRYGVQAFRKTKQAWLMSAKDTAPRPNSDGAETQREATALLGEFSALLRRLGSPAPQTPPIVVTTDARTFLAAYQTRVLGPVELPAIVRAHHHAAHSQWRELLALDAQLAGEPLLRPFAEGSRQIGRIQLERLRPLRDERLAQRYLAAVESGQAHGWHTLVYGIILAVYSWPLRQGLIHYGRETMSGLAEVSQAASPLDDDALRVVVDQAISDSKGCYISSIASP
jgi:urease accessory protein UreF